MLCYLLIYLLTNHTFQLYKLKSLSFDSLFYACYVVQPDMQFTDSVMNGGVENPINKVIGPGFSGFENYIDFLRCRIIGINAKHQHFRFETNSIYRRLFRTL